MATHSSILTCKTPWTESGRQQSTRWQKAKHEWATKQQIHFLWVLLLWRILTNTSPKKRIWKMCVGEDGSRKQNWSILCFATSLSHVQLFVTPWTIAHQTPLFVRFSRQDYWSGFLCPPPGDLPDPGIESVSLAVAGRFFTVWATWEAHVFGTRE